MSEWNWANTDVKELIESKTCVVTWSGGLDSTSLIAYAIKEYKCELYPIFVNRNQTNYERERDAVLFYNQYFESMFKEKFHQSFEVAADSPPLAFKEKFKGRKEIYVLRNSDLVNQAARYAILLGIETILVGSLPDDVSLPDNTMAFWRDKTNEIRTGTGNRKITIVPVFSHHQVRFSKSKVIKWCNENGIDVSRTWSCFWKGPKPCMNIRNDCEACRTRIEAFAEAKIKDPSSY